MREWMAVSKLGAFCSEPNTQLRKGTGRGLRRPVVVRHGQDRWNCEGRIQGQIDGPLSDLGLRHAEAIAARLREWPLLATLL